MKILNIRAASEQELAAAVRIDRKTRWGNPFVIGRDGDRDEVIEKYRRWLWQEIKARRIGLIPLSELAGRDLACWCAPNRCRGEVLAQAASWAVAELRK